MDRSILQELETIQITYPAPYSQSWTCPKPGQNKKRKSSMPQNFKQMKHPAPYSQSWTYTEPVHNRRKTLPLLRNAKDSIDPLRIPWLQCETKVRKSDATAPHLKYGMFPSRPCVMRQMTYPAPYSQSWTCAKPVQNMRKRSSVPQNFKQMKHPSLYSQSWTYTEPVHNRRKSLPLPRNAKDSIDPLRKPWLQCETKVRKSDATAPHLKYGMFPSRPCVMSQMKYPAPYSQPWTYTEPVHNRRKTLPLSRNAKDSTDPLRIPWLQCETKARKSDATAPHLKYGMFPSRPCVMRRGQSRTLSLKPPKHLSQSFDYTNVRKELKRTPRKGHLIDAPMLIFRTIDKRYTRQLSLSKVMHIDIKPRRNPPMSRKNVSPALSSSPMGRSLR